MVRWLVIVLLLVAAVLIDVALGVLQPTRGLPPLLTLAVVAVIALSSGARAGMLTGFAAGLILDLLAGPTALAGTLALVGLAVGAVVGSTRRRGELQMTGHAALTGAVAVAGGGVLCLALRALAGVHVRDVVGDVLVTGAVTGLAVTPLIFRLAVWPLLESSSAS